MSIAGWRKIPEHRRMEEWMNERLRMVGLNAEWAVSAWLFKGNHLKDALYITDNEDDSWSLLRRKFNADGDDTIEELMTTNARGMRKFITNEIRKTT